MTNLFHAQSRMRNFLGPCIAVSSVRTCRACKWGIQKALGPCRPWYSLGLDKALWGMQKASEPHMSLYSLGLNKALKEIQKAFGPHRPLYSPGLYNGFQGLSEASSACEYTAVNIIESSYVRSSAGAHASLPPRPCLPAEPIT